MKKIPLGANTFIALTASAIMATACVSPAEIAAADKKACVGYGFAEGTDAFANCMMQANQNRQRASFAREQQWQAEEQQRRLAQQQRNQTEMVRPTHEQCMTAGNSTMTGNSTSSFSNTVCASR